MSTADWSPLESSPEQLTHLLAKFVPNTQLVFTDIYSMDDLEVLFPFPVKSCLFLYPIDSSASPTSANTPPTAPPPPPPTGGVQFMKQYVGNACGTIAVLHAILNTSELVSNAIPQVQRLIELKDAKERGNYLQNEVKFKQLHSDSVNVASQREVNDDDMDTMLHFVCFVYDESGEWLVELDGRHDTPVYHGKASGSLLADVCQVVKKKIAESNGSLEFTLLGLVEAENLL